MLCKHAAKLRLQLYIHAGVPEADWQISFAAEALHAMKA